MLIEPGRPRQIKQTDARGKRRQQANPPPTVERPFRKIVSKKQTDGELRPRDGG
jgi:hypothetical protein